MKVALGQINPTIGDFVGNRRLIEGAIDGAEAAGADLLVFPELAVCGYPPKDLLERPAFLQAAEDVVHSVAAELAARGSRLGVVLGHPHRLSAAATTTGRAIANAATLIDDGRVVATIHKSLLPTYDVFDEWRYFEPATDVQVVPFRGCRLAISICEDIWNDADFWPRRLYRQDPIELLMRAGADVIVNIAASPFTVEKRQLRPRMLAATARRWGVPLVFVNQVGGQDDLIFDGASAVFDRTGQTIAQARENAEDVVFADLESGVGDRRAAAASVDVAALDALVLGTRDYARRCGFKAALVGLSGGVDSALVACIAEQALGSRNVLGVAMPSRFSSPGSLTDARALAVALAIDFDVVSIEPMFSAYVTELDPLFDRTPGAEDDRAREVSHENLQARVRGAILMALSNATGRLLLTTGNKSEVATGYCTLYGDMAGGLAVISDVPKTMVYRLARAFNALHGGSSCPVIPESTLTKPPSAELRPNQTDQDSLPPYDLLDAILEGHLERGLDHADLVAAGFAPDVVDDVLRRVRLSEYKRRQMPPGLKITGKAFGPGRRMPIAQAWKG